MSPKPHRRYSRKSVCILPGDRGSHKTKSKTHPTFYELFELASRHGLKLPKDLSRILARDGRSEQEARIALTKQFKHQFPKHSEEEITNKVNKAIDMHFSHEIKKMEAENQE